MADVTVTANEVLPDSGSRLETHTLGGTVTAGQTVYKNTSGLIVAADAGAAATSTVLGIAMTGGVTSQSIVVCVGGTLDPGFTCGVGTPYFQSNTAGGICPAADLANPMRTSVIGVGITASQLGLVLYNSGATVP